MLPIADDCTGTTEYCVLVDTDSWMKVTEPAE